jgi:cobalt-zinc-cadmium resistance protein CzcA
MDGIILTPFFNRALEAGTEPSAALLRTCEVRMRPVMMTCIVTCVGLLPAALSTGIGSQVQKPLAIVVVGGSLLAPLLILLVLPVLIDLFSRRRQLVEAPEPRPAPAE